MSGQVITIIKKELHDRRWYLLWWSLGIIVLVALTVLAYGSIQSQADQLNKTFSHLSSNISGFVGTSDMFSPVGYLNSQLYYITLPILFILLSITLTNSLVSKEEGRRTLELLLARPISRSRLLIAKALSGTAVVAILGIVAAAAVIVCGLTVHIGVAAGYMALATLLMVLFSGAYGAVAFMFYAASLRSRRLAAIIAILLSFGGYILTSLGGIVHGLAWVAKLFPYHYYDPGAILTGKVSTGLIIYMLAMYVVSISVALLGFRHRDISN